jgi:hypothetical protein
MPARVRRDQPLKHRRVALGVLPDRRYQSATERGRKPLHGTLGPEPREESAKIAETTTAPT